MSEGKPRQKYSKRLAAEVEVAEAEAEVEVTEVDAQPFIIILHN